MILWKSKVHGCITTVKSIAGLTASVPGVLRQDAYSFHTAAFGTPRPKAAFIQLACFAAAQPPTAEKPSNTRVQVTLLAGVVMQEANG